MFGPTRLLLLSVLLVFSPLSLAATYFLPADIGVNGTPFKDCSGAGPTYTCSKKITIDGGDIVELTSDVTLDIDDVFIVSTAGEVDNKGFVFNVNAEEIEINGAGTVLMDNLTAIDDIVILDQADLTANLVSTNRDIVIEGDNATINGNLDAPSGDIAIEGDNATINGNVNALGDIDIIGADATINGSVNALTGDIAFEGGNATINGDIDALAGDIAFEGGNATINGNIDALAGDIAIQGGNTTIIGNIDAQNGDVLIEDGNNFVDGNISADNGNGFLEIDATSIVSGTCNPDHPRCNGGPYGGGGPNCDITQIAADGEEFRGISGSSDSNVIAAGNDGSLYHYDGATWTKNAFVSPEDLRDVEVVAANLAYAVGKKGKVLKYDGAAWSTLPKPTNEELMGVWADASGVVWVVGKKSVLYRWDGANWQDMSGGGQANVDNNQELRDAWGNGSVFYALEKDGDLYRYTRPGGPWSKRTACSAAFDMDVRDIWGDGSGNIYIAGKDKAPNPDEAAIFRYNEGSDSCSIEFSTSTANDLEGIYGNYNTIYAVGTDGLVVDNTLGSFTQSNVGVQDYKDVWVSSSNMAYYVGQNGTLTTCIVPLDHFVVSPASLDASTCLPNAITIRAEDAGNNILIGYLGTVDIGTSSNHGNWSINAANGVLNPDPDNDDDGAVDYSFDPQDAGVAILDLENTHAEDMIISVSEGAVTRLSANINFGDNVFVITEDPVQVAGRSLAMNIAMWRNDRGAANCAIDTNYDYSPQSLDVSIDRNGVLPAANDPSISGTAIVETPASIAISLDFQTTPGQATFVLDNNDVGQYRLLVTDNTLVHSDSAIVGTSAVMTLRPFGIAITNLRDTLTSTANPMNAAPAGAIFTTAGHNLSATVSGVLWDLDDDGNNDGVLDTGVYTDNALAPSFAWNTDFVVSLLASSYTPSPGTPGVLNNFSVPQLDFSGGSASVTNLQYTEVGSFTLQAAVNDYLGEATADIGGEDIVVGRFIPAGFEVTIIDNGIMANTCGAFTYVGEEFGYDTAPRINVTAINSLGDTTTQYRDAFVKLNGSSVTVAVDSDETTTGTDLALLDVSYSPAAMSFAPQNNGIVNYTLGADLYRYGPNAIGEFSKNDNSQVAPFSADIDPEITAVAEVEVASSYTAGTYKLDPTGNSQRFGRLRMENVHGSELNPLLMPVFTEFWNGFSFQKNSLDTCSTIAASNLVSMPTPAGLPVPAVVDAPAAAGDVTYSYPSPGAGNKGYIDTTTDLSAAAHLWLRHDWDADNEFDDDPTARATYGIFEGNPVQIYIQQVYQ